MFEKIDFKRILFLLLKNATILSIEKFFLKWSFENDDEAGSITFENGTCEIETGQMKYNSWEADERLDFSTYESSEKLKKLAILFNL